MYAFGNDNGFQYTHLIDKVNVTNSLGIDPNEPAIPASSSPSLLSTGVIVGIVVGVVVVFVGGVFLLIRKIQKCRSKVNSTMAAADKDTPTTPGDDDNNRKSGDDGGPNYLYLEAKHPYWRPSSTESLPLASMTTVPEHLQERLRALEEQMRAVQAQIQVTTQFSSHPRPKVVTTVSSDKEPTPTPPLSLKTGFGNHSNTIITDRTNGADNACTKSWISRRQGLVLSQCSGVLC
ncbi:MAG: hypothetical protein JOS17DRAFT_746441 [Linnemannia elongata]|nr:MAG: hypothetical protein JOS17DRAFT_746441 [Linnemannia elongata]